MTRHGSGERARRPSPVLVAALGCVALGGALIAVGASGASVPPPAVPPPARETASPTMGPAPSESPPPAGAPGEPAERGVQELADPSWVKRTSAGSGIPVRALRAYAGAAVRAADEYPGCGLGWNTLAGIGHVESEHGTIDGAQLGSDGAAAPPIIGIALDGSRTAAIRDTDAGALDGDAVWDRAVGPMQFLPGTWADWAADGDLDGVTNPQDIDDAALAAARYLCAIGGDLTRADRWIAAIAAYNDTIEYNNRVADAAAYYAGFG